MFYIQNDDGTVYTKDGELVLFESLPVAHEYISKETGKHFTAEYKTDGFSVVNLWHRESNQQSQKLLFAICKVKTIYG